MKRLISKVKIFDDNYVEPVLATEPSEEDPESLENFVINIPQPGWPGYEEGMLKAALRLAAIQSVAAMSLVQMFREGRLSSDARVELHWQGLTTKSEDAVLVEAVLAGNRLAGETHKDFRIITNADGVTEVNQHMEEIA